MRLQRLLAGVLIVSGIGVMTACGSDAKEAISKSDFITQANALCAKTQDAIAAGETALGDEPTEEQVTGYIADIGNEILAANKSIRALGLPDGDEALLNGILDETDAIANSIVADPASVLSADDNPFAAPNERFTAYGLTVCGEE